jgi:hypothetical protein
VSGRRVTPDEDGLIFVGTRGTPLRRGNFRRRVWLAVLKKAGLPAVHFNALRHAGNSLTVHAGANLRELMARMGHSSTRAALIYLHSTDERQRELADAFSELAAGELKRKTARPRDAGGRSDATGTAPEQRLMKINSNASPSCMLRSRLPKWSGAVSHCRVPGLRRSAQTIWNQTRFTQAL